MALRRHRCLNGAYGLSNLPHSVSQAYGVWLSVFHHKLAIAADAEAERHLAAKIPPARFLVRLHRGNALAASRDEGDRDRAGGPWMIRHYKAVATYNEVEAASISSKVEVNEVFPACIQQRQHPG